MYTYAVGGVIYTERKVYDITYSILLKFKCYFAVYITLLPVLYLSA